jgi:hypothetical protein
MVECDAIDCCGFVFYVFGLCHTMEMDANWPHLTHQPWFLVSNFAIRKLVLIYIHKKETKDSQRCSSPFLLFVMFCLAPVFCHVLFGAIFLSCSVWRYIYHYQIWYSCACTLCDNVWRSKRGPNGRKKHGHIHIVHHPTIMMNDRCSFDGCDNRPTKHGNGRCRTHGGRTKCNHRGVIALPKRVTSVGVIDLIKYVAVQQVAPSCPKRMEFARHMVELEFAKFMDIQGVYLSPECALFITQTRLFLLQSMRMQW